MYKKAETSVCPIFIFSSLVSLLIAMPATRRSKAIKTPEFIKSDTEDSNGSGDYGDKDKYVFEDFIYFGFMLNGFIQR
jgi:hypothetical protein